MIDALDAGIAANDPEKARESADVKAWADKLKRARDYDEPAREQYAQDRKYARGDSGCEVDANVVGTNIDILEAFFYAKDPDFSAVPTKAMQPPTVESMRDAVKLSLGADGAMLDPLVQPIVEQQVAELRRKYGKQLREIRSFGRTIEIVGSRLWADAGLKRRARKMVRSALTIGIGVIKASWQERTAPSPETVQAIHDLQDNIQRLKSLQQDIEDSNGDNDAMLAEYERQLAALQGQAEQVVARGFCVDVVQGEDFQIPEGFALADHCDAPWNAHRIFMRTEDAKAEFELDKDKLAQATKYTARKPEMVKRESALIVKTNADEADAFVMGGGEGPSFVAIWEIWDRTTNHVLTMIEGMRCWAKPAWEPPATTRFYPFFLLSTSEVDGQRHPQSLTSRSAKLVDEYNRIGSAEAEHRRRILPGVLFDKGALGPESAKDIAKAATGEYIGVQPTQPNRPLSELFYPKAYPPIDPSVYDRSRIINELERIWGVQEALSGSIDTAKTATEAEIQQSGFNARTGARRDALDSLLSDLALYTAEISRRFLDTKDAVEMAGDHAFWPPYTGPDDLRRLLTITIRAGSSGKPNTSADRQAWGALLPMLQNAVLQVGQLRQASPTAIADSLEELIRITSERSGETLNMDDLIPQADSALPMMPGLGQPPMPGAAPAMPAEPAMAEPPIL